ncbi:vacuole-associated enzyme activator complex component Vac14 [Pseudozyma hubeiensis SY62]|uniref:Vacuole-associated enzyme activator complex component Vac14 n=1 Tax=Pseudozyma hubeiensis (strain SY62) TaxID=1305764 RepID=R9P6V3_PSEHS|nr:vacuole-associated enzyme activator complex component Vac14 [Pseudozyma hubeiensis SY62]GAC96972.1 vacuole-associated enzyme activator complex component Vac14 [Pseudozyma hubeiensis SY62]
MDAALQKALLDRVYDKRKAATLDLERQVRDCLARGDRARVNLIVQQLCSFLSTSPQNVNARNGGLIGLAGIAIALGVELAPFLEQIAKPVLACFNDPDSKIRYFACESFYNIAKVCKGEILVYFNETFDALSKLAADSELSVKNGAELLDRLLKDIVCEAAPHYVSQFQDISLIRAHQDAQDGFAGGAAELDVAREKAHQIDEEGTASNKVFSLARFIPLLAERIYVLSPFTRNYLVSWITVLGSVPELELITYLPSFLDGLLKYLSDPNTDVRVATANVLADFLREIRHAAELAAKRHAFEQHRAERQEHKRLKGKQRIMPSAIDSMPPKSGAPEDALLPSQFESQPRSASPSKSMRSSSKTPSTKPRSEGGTSPLPPQQDGHDTDQGVTEDVGNESAVEDDHQEAHDEDEEEDIWVDGTEVRIEYAAIVEILINHIGYPDEEIQATTLQWIAEFLLVVKDVVVPFTPRLISAILPSLAHHSPAIASAAHATNINLYRVIQDIAAPAAPPSARPRISSATAALQGHKHTNSTSSGRERNAAGSPTQHGNLNRHGSVSRPAISSSTTPISTSIPATGPISPRSRANTLSGEPATSMATLTLSESTGNDDRTTSPTQNGNDALAEDEDPFDYQMTVNALILQLLDEHEETRVSALEWLLMLHRKSPQKILSMDDGTFPALLKTLSDPSDEVIRCDLRLLAQISSASEDSYFHAFMANLLSLFSTDRRLLETRGSLIIRQLCASLHTERIFRTLAEILEKDEDLEFASIMVQNLAIILITSPELADFRKKLRNLDSREGQQLFVSIYRCWCHNAVAAFSLCLLAQAYEHASNLLTIFAELEITVSLLIQIDKLVQLLESPIFTALRLQLLEPERYPYLFKCLYGILMLLPQSSAFVTLRNRLNAVNGLGFLHSVPRSSYSSRTGSKSVSSSGGASAGGGGTGTGGSSAGGSASMVEIKWNDLLHHFRVVQNKHERARRQATAGATAAGGGTHLAPDYAAPRITSSGGAASSSASSMAGGAAGGRRRINQAATPATGSTTPSTAPGRFGLGLSSSASNGRSSSAVVSAPNTGTSSFFGIHLPSTASAATASPTSARSSSPSAARRYVSGQQQPSNPGSRQPSKGSSLRQ